MTTLKLTAAAVVAVVLAGCASQPPPELKTARTAYQQAVTAPGANLASPDVYEAKKSLERAETAFNENGDEPETRDLAYVAQRKALIARSNASTAIAVQNQRVALAEIDRLKVQQEMANRDKLGKDKEKLTQAQLESERAARVAQDKQREEALRKIQGLTTKQDARGLVVTLGGGVLFATGKSELAPAARKRLDTVIAALQIGVAVKDEGRDVIVVGHTDSTGDAEKNMMLSQRRAEEVRMYLTTHGIPADRATAQGVGDKEPTADNKTAQGRASNRRVEIILTEPTQKGKVQPGMGASRRPRFSEPADGV